MFQNILKVKKLNALLITNPTNIGYLSDFWGSFSYFYIGPKKQILFTDGRYFEEAKKSVKTSIIIEDYQNLNKVLKNKTIGFEANQITVSQLKSWKKNFNGTKFKPTTNIIENLRIKKQNFEIEKIKKATQINDKILDEIKKMIKIGITEKELAWKIREMAFQFGCTELAFESIVNFGKHTAHPHHKPDNTKLKKGELILIDFGVKYQKYCSDITRVFFTNTPTSTQKNVFEIVLEAQQKAIQTANQTSNCNKIDQSARQYIESQKFAEYFNHSLGHSVGLDIHESPSLSSLSKSKLTENSVFTIEPGIYLPGKFGIRLEDLFIYQNKTAIQLSNFTKEIKELIIQQ